MSSDQCKLVSRVEPMGDTPIYERTEARLTEHYERLSKRPSNVRRPEDCEQWLNEGIAIIRQHHAALDQAYRDAGLPYTLDTEDDYWEAADEPLLDLERTIGESPALTVEGVHAKLRMAADCITRYGNGDLILEQRIVIMAADDLDRLEGGAS